MTEDAPLNPNRSKDADDELDMTPMVDVTFLLLIFFMITAAFALQKAMEVPPVDDDKAAPVEIIEEPEKDTVIVRLDEDNVYWVTAPIFETEGDGGEKKAVSRQDMRELVRTGAEAGGGQPLRKILVQAHGDATHEFMVAAIDAGAAIPMEQIRLMIYEDEGEL